MPEGPRHEGRKEGGTGAGRIDRSYHDLPPLAVPVKTRTHDPLWALTPERITAGWTPFSNPAPGPRRSGSRRYQHGAARLLQVRDALSANRPMAPGGPAATLSTLLPDRRSPGAREAGHRVRGGGHEAAEDHQAASPGRLAAGAAPARPAGVRHLRAKELARPAGARQRGPVARRGPGPDRSGQRPSGRRRLPRAGRA